MKKNADIGQPTFIHEDVLISQGFNVVAGIDEAGRGPLAGPVVAASVVLNRDFIPEGLNDSKKLTDEKLREMYEVITAHSDYAVAEVSHSVIDSIGIQKAIYRAMAEASAGLKHGAKAFIIDGQFVPPGIKGLGKSLIDGDALSLSVAAASVVAKVHRDNLMIEFAKQYPEYAFDEHMGYPTKKHQNAIKQFGPCPIHRMTFGMLKKYAAMTA